MASAKTNQKSKVYSILKDKIINCIYSPGTLLNETQLAEELSVSRTPVREAISQLESEGWLKVLVKKGIYVSDIQISDVFQIFQARLEIEPIALRMAAPYLPTEELLIFKKKFQEEFPDMENAFRLDTAMHLFIIEHCGNHFIIEMMQTVFDCNTRVIISSKQNQVQIHDARNEHLEIINLLLDKKFEEAELQMRKHIEACKRAAIDFFYSLGLCSAPTKNYLRELEKLDESLKEKNSGAV